MNKLAFKKLSVIAGFSIVGVTITKLAEWNTESWILGWAFGLICYVIIQLIDEE
jgi:hypothetical protein